MKLKLFATLAAAACGMALAQMTPAPTGTLRADKDSPTAHKDMVAPQPGTAVAPAARQPSARPQPAPVNRAPTVRSPAATRAAGDESPKELSTRDKQRPTKF